MEFNMAEPKEYRITSENILQSSPNDCLLPGNDIAHEIIAQNFLGGLGYREYQLQQVQREYFERLEKINENSRNRPNFPK